MTLPASVYPVQPSDENLARATELIAVLEAANDTNDSASSALAELIDLTGNTTLTAAQYFEISGAMSYRAAATLAFCPAARVIEGLDFAGFVTLCETVQKRLTKDDFEYWFAIFVKNARCSDPGDLLFYPPQSWIDELIAAGEIDKMTTQMNFTPTLSQLADKAWSQDAPLPQP